MRRVSLSALAVVAAACGSSKSPTSVNSPSKGVACATGSITLGAVVNGDLDSASTCKRLNTITGDSTLTASYSLSVQSGHGYLLTMAGQNLHTVMQLVSPGDTLLAASPTYLGPSSQVRLLFAREVTETDTVRATAFDTLASDTGAFTITPQSCKVPVPPLVQPTDSITHNDTVGIGDCQVLLSDFFDNPHDEQVSVHLYALHFSAATNYRQVTINADSPVWLFMGGPGDDAFAAVPGHSVESIDTATTHTINNFGTGKGDFTFVVAAAEPASYTLTIGAEHPYMSVTRFSRSRSRPLVVRRR